MHMYAAGIDLEVEIYSTKLANETSPWIRTMDKVRNPRNTVLYLWKESDLEVT
jgi:hypothetical protein